MRLDGFVGIGVVEPFPGTAAFEGGSAGGLARNGVAQKRFFGSLIGI